VLRQYFEKSAETIDKTIEQRWAIDVMAGGIHSAHLAGNKILIAGNGGSCSDAEHLACELTCTFKNRSREGFCAINLANNPSAITAWSNDFGYEGYFARQVESIGRKGDILFLISTGGGEVGASMNLVNAAKTAKNIGMTIYSLIGKTGGILQSMSDAFIKIPSFETSHIQETHIVCIHAICSVLEEL
jgi:D-sedoheptulose 7-phosphate isomerase